MQIFRKTDEILTFEDRRHDEHTRSWVRFDKGHKKGIEIYSYKGEGDIVLIKRNILTLLEWLNDSVYLEFLNDSV